MASIYEIDKEIMECVDEETGEILDKEKLDALNIERAAKVENIACWVKNLATDAEAIKTEENALAARRKAKEKKADALKEYLRYALSDAPFESAKCKISFRHSSSVEVINETLIPAEYFKTEIVKKVDKMALGDALKGGELIDGVQLKISNNIQIR